MGASSHSLSWMSTRSYKKMLVMKRRKAATMKRRRTRCEKGKEDDGLERRVRTLKRLVPKSGSDPNGLEGLFCDTADYILDLQMRVRVMQMMVDALSTCAPLPLIQ